MQVTAAEPGVAVLGVIDYSFGKYLILPLPGEKIQVLSRHESSEQTAQPDAGAFESAHLTC